MTTKNGTRKGVKMTNIKDHWEVASVHAGVDWLTMTCSSTEARDRLEGLIATIVVEEEELGYRPATWHFKGYRGHNWKSLSYGKRPQDDIVVAKGQLADRLFWSLSAYARQVSRVDLQVTAMLKNPCPDLALTCYTYLGELVREGAVNVPSNRLILGDARTRGDTLYIGSRKSSQMGRMYDKGVQEKTDTPGYKWRYEVEYKKPLAYRLAKALRESRDRSFDIIGTVHEWFDNRYCVPVFDKRGSKIVTEVVARIHSDEVTLAWLRSQISPSVLRLMQNGKGREVFTALQLPLYGPFDTTSHD